MRVVVILCRILVLLVALGGVGLIGTVTAFTFVHLRAGERGLVRVEPPEQRQKTINAVPFLAVGALLGLVGGLMAVCGRTGNGATWLLLAGGGPLLLSPWAWLPAGILVAAGLLSLVAFVLDLTTRPRAEVAT